MLMVFIQLILELIKMQKNMMNLSYLDVIKEGLGCNGFNCFFIMYG